jgi:hypothetical protein
LEAVKRNLTLAIAAVSCNVDFSTTEKARQEFGVTLLGRESLLMNAADNDETMELTHDLFGDIETAAAVMVVEPVDVDDDVANLNSYGIDPNLQVKPPTAESISSKLIDELKHLPTGADGNDKKYEDLGLRIARHLFGSRIVNEKIQHTTFDNLHRFDYVFRIREQDPIGRFISHVLQSPYVLIEFKNYGEPITQHEVTTTEKYLYVPAYRRVAFIFSRKGPDKGCVTHSQGALRGDGKLVLVFSDEDLIRLLTQRDSGLDATDAIFEKIDDQLLGLTR